MTNKSPSHQELSKPEAQTQGTNRLNVVGSEKHIEFGGNLGPGINIPGGLREPEHPLREVPEGEYVDGYGTAGTSEPASQPQTIGADKHIEFGGNLGSGMNIPGGLREPGDPVTASKR